MDAAKECTHKAAHDLRAILDGLLIGGDAIADKLGVLPRFDFIQRLARLLKLDWLVVGIHYRRVHAPLVERLHLGKADILDLHVLL